MRFFKRLFLALLGLTLFGLLAGIGGALYLYYNYGQDLPDETQLANYAPAIVTRVHAGDGSLLAEYAIENRVFVPLDVIPEQVKLAFIAAEDQNFYSHPGVDFMGVLRAVIQNLKNMGSNARPIGASTITQQVAKNFLLTNEVSLARKIKEAILAFRIEGAFTKDQILELYLNEIYLGRGNYGVVTAALNYFDKSLAELTLAETAYLAALPKAPANYDPERQKAAAVERRNYVLDRMAEDGYVTAEEAAAAKAEDLVIHPRVVSAEVKADYFAEEVRRQIQRIYGDDALYKGGLVVRSTLDPRLQKAAEKALRDGIYNYDRNHGWRGPVARMVFDDEALAKAEAEREEFIAANPESPIPPLPYDARVDGWKKTLPTIPVPPGSSPWLMAVVLEVLDDQDQVLIGLADGTRGYIPMAELTWARPWLPDQRVGEEPKNPSTVLALGDVILVEAVTADAEGKPYEVAGAFGLRQIPNVSGAFLAMDPHTGRVLAMVGGWSFEESEFNRATQAWRQPGSSFKPYVYLAALEAGFTPATIVLDAPFVLDQGPGEPKWKPKNYGSDFLGPVTMRVGIEKSRNLMTVRLAQTIGMATVVDYARRFGVIDDMPAVLSMALGSTETTLLRQVTGYAQIDNGCKKITPTFIDSIQDRYGKVIYRHDERPCPDCLKAAYDGTLPPTFTDDRPLICDPISAYQMTTMLQGVIQRGTGSRVAVVGKPIAGKTGTTNENFDVWFVGFTPDLAAGVYIGFDQPRTLGHNDTGSSVASPIFRDFMLEALKDAPATPFRVPPGVTFVPIDQSTGQVSSGGAGSITEAFKPGTEPKPGDQALDGGYTPGAEDNTVTGVPGVY